jgi:hypothetical protein
MASLRQSLRSQMHPAPASIELQLVCVLANLSVQHRAAPHQVMQFHVHTLTKLRCFAADPRLPGPFGDPFQGTQSNFAALPLIPRSEGQVHPTLTHAPHHLGLPSGLHDCTCPWLSGFLISEPHVTRYDAGLGSFHQACAECRWACIHSQTHTRVSSSHS